MRKKNEFTRFLDLKFFGSVSVNWIPKPTRFRIEKIGIPICEE
jgi:hypothetical protein